LLLLSIALGVSALVPARAAPPAQTGVVTRVVDGDSVWVTPAGGKPVAVRLAGIDAPELCQPWGPEARDALRDRVLGREVTLQPRGHDGYGRLLATLLLDGSAVNAQQVEDGNAWSQRYKWDLGPYVKEERVAQALGRGLFGQGGAVRPRDFRQRHGPCEGPAPARAGAASSPVPAPAAATAPAPRAAPMPATEPALFRCDGRTRCSQMHSCAEAKFFLAHCPAVKMDGDHDGVPCETQWCR
jgi:endonuclease YncB( thermonuclease family)